MPSRAGKKLLKAAEARPHTDASTLEVFTNIVLNLRLSQSPSYIPYFREQFLPLNGFLH